MYSNDSEFCGIFLKIQTQVNSLKEIILVISSHYGVIPIFAGFPAKINVS